MKTILLSEVAVLATVSLAMAQASPTPFVTQPYSLDSGDQANSRNEAVTMFSAEVSAPGTPLMRLSFGECTLGEASWVAITSMTDGATQYLDSASLEAWDHASAVFNGDTVIVELVVAPGEEDIYFTLDGVSAAPVSLALDPIESICGSNDNRVPSSDPRVGRLLFGGCTGWLVSNGAALTAGHCTPLSGVMEFDVPQSLSNGTPVAAHPDNQYPLTGTLGFDEDGPGDDWAVFTIGPNSNTGLRAHVVRGFFRMTSNEPPDGATMRVTGYGLDNMPSGPGGGPCCDVDSDGNCNNNCNSSSLTEQTATGAYDTAICCGSDILRYTVDTTPANSGSPVIRESSGVAVGIHTHGGCDSFLAGNDNEGTAFSNGQLESSLHNVQGASARYCDSGLFGLPQNGGVFEPFNTVAPAVASVANGGVISIVAGNYPASAGNTFVAGADGKAITFKSPVGLARIGN